MKLVISREGHEHEGRRVVILHFGRCIFVYPYTLRKSTNTNTIS